MTSQYSLKNEHKPEKPDNRTLLTRCGFTIGAGKRFCAPGHRCSTLIPISPLNISR